MIASDWKLTLDPAGTPLVILDYGELLADELEFSGTRTVGITPLVRGAAPHLRNGKNIYLSLSLRVHRPADTWPLARAAALATAMAALAKDKAPLRVETTGVSGYTQYASCLVSAAAGGIDPGEGRWHVTSYSLVAVTPTITP